MNVCWKAVFGDWNSLNLQWCPSIFVAVIYEFSHSLCCWHHGKSQSWQFHSLFIEKGHDNYNQNFANKKQRHHRLLFSFHVLEQSGSPTVATWSFWYFVPSRRATVFSCNKKALAKLFKKDLLGWCRSEDFEKRTSCLNFSLGPIFVQQNTQTNQRHQSSLLPAGPWLGRLGGLVPLQVLFIIVGVVVWMSPGLINQADGIRSPCGNKVSWKLVKHKRNTGRLSFEFGDIYSVSNSGTIGYPHFVFGGFN